MNKLRFFMFLFLTGCMNLAMAQWQSIPLPSSTTGNHTMYSTVVSGTRILTATSNGVYLSDDDGAHWQMSNSGISNPSVVNSLVLKGSTLVVGTSGGSIYTSSNNGNSWQLQSTISTFNLQSLATQGSTLYAISNNHVYASTNSVSWTDVTNNLSGNLGEMIAKGSDLFVISNNGQIHKSTDNGASWQSASNGLPSVALYSLATDGTNLWVGTFSGVYKSIDNGATWTSTWSGLPTGFTALEVANFSNNMVMASTSQMLYVSADGGNSWTPKGNIFSSSQVIQFAEYNAKVYAATYFMGMYSSVDQGNSWTQINDGIGVAADKAFITAGQLYIRGGQTTYASSDEGLSWNTVPALPQDVAAGVSYQDGNRIWLGTYNGLFYSDDNASSWTKVSGDDIPATNFGVEAITKHNNTICLGTNMGVLTSTDGVNWNTYTVNTNVTDLASFNGKLYAVSGNKLYESVNAQSWTMVSSLSSQTVVGLKNVNNKLYIHGIGLYVTSDGNTYTTLSYGENSNITTMAVYNEALIICTYPGNVYLSQDEGVTWAPFRTGLPPNGIRSITVTEHYLILVKDSPWEMYRRPLTDIVPCPFATSITGPVNVCAGQNPVSYSVPAQAGVTYSWQVSPSATIASGNNTAAISVNFDNTDATITLVQTATGCTKTLTVPVTVTEIGGGYAYGNSNICAGTTGTFYSSLVIPGATYTWTVLTGDAVIASGQNTPTMKLAVGTGDGTFKVEVSKNGCTSQTGYSAYYLRGAPEFFPTDPRDLCAGTFSTFSVQGKYLPESYFTWTAPEGYSLNEGQGRGYQQVVAGTVSGQVTVSATNECGTSASPQVWQVNIVPPLQMPVFTGPAEVTEGEQVTFSVPAQTGVHYFEWTVPTGTVITSGEGTNTIGVTFGATSGNVSVTLYHSGCSSVSSNYAVTVSTVVRPTASIRSASVCGGYTAEFFNLSGTFPLTVVLKDQTQNSYSFVLNSTTDNKRILPANKTYTIYSVTDANAVSAVATGMAGTFTTSTATLTMNPGSPATVNCVANLSLGGVGTGTGVFEWYRIVNGQMENLDINDFYYSTNKSGQYMATFTTSAGCVKQSPLADVTVNNPMPDLPAITPAGPVNVTCGQAVNIDMTATSGYPYYRWYRNGGLITNANLNTYTATTAGTYSVAVSNDNTCYTGTWGTDVVITQTVQPAKPVLNRTGGVFILCGQSTNLNVTNLDLNVYDFAKFKWYKDGVLIAGANTPAYVVTDAGIYTVQGSKDGICYSDLSAPVSAQIQLNNGISIMPSNGTFNIPCGSTMDLIATTGYPSYNWYKDGVMLTTHTNVLLAITQSGRYEVESVSPSCTSLRAVLNITSGSTSSVMYIAPPSLINVLCGQTTTLRSSTTVNYYRWYKDGILIPSATASTYVVTETGDYTLSGSSDGICYSMPGPVVHVNVALPGVSATISSFKPQISCGEKAQLNATPTSYAYYKWYLNGQLYQTTNTPVLNTNNQGTYTVAMSNDNSCYSPISSSSVAVTLNAQPATLQINYNNSSYTYTLNSGNNQLFRTGASSGIFDTYQWQSTADNSDNNWTDIPGATAENYNFINTNLRYRLKGMFSGCMSSYSNAVRINVPEVMVDIFSAMGSVMCTTQAKLTATPGYQQYTWRNTTTNTVIGTTTVPEISLSLFGQGTAMYRVTASGVDQFGVQYSGTSMARSVVVLNDITPVLSPPVLACSSASGYITISSPSGGYASYQWSNASGLLGTTRDLLVQEGGNYTLTVTDYAGCTATVSTTVTESSASADYTPVLTTQSGGTSFCLYSNTVLTVSNIASLPSGTYQYQWYKNGQLHSTTTTATLSVTQVGQYALQIIPTGATNKCIGYSNTLNLINYPAINTSVTAPANNSFCIGQSQVLTAASGTGYSYAWGTATGSQLGYPSFIFTAISGATQQSFAPTMNQNITVKITDDNGCVAYSTPNSVQMIPMPTMPVIYQQITPMNNQPAPATITACSGTIVLSAIAVYGQQPAFPIKWYKDGVIVTGNTTLSVTTSGTYTLEYTTGPCSKTSTPVVVNFSVAPVATIAVQNGTISGTDIQICSEGQATLTAPVAPLGKTYSYKWFILSSASQYIPGGSTPYTNNTLTLNTSNVNKVIILEVTEGGCRSNSQAYTLRVITTPTTQPSVAAGNACGQSVVTFTAVGTLQSFWKYRWTDNTGNTVQESTANTFTTPLLSTTTAYYVAYVNNVCVSSRKATAVANISIPAVPVAANVSRCGTGSVTLTAAGNTSGTYNWYDNQTGGVIGTGASYTTSSLNNSRSYYVASSVTVSGQACLSTRVPVSVTIKTIPVVTTNVTNLRLCSGTTGNITAVGADTYVWKQGNTVIATTAVLNPVGTVATNYTVEGTTNGCTGAPVAVSVTVNPLPVINISSSAGSSICTGTSTTLTAYGLTSYNWYTPSALTGTLLGQGSTLSVTPTANATYEVRGTDAAGCTNSKSVSIQVQQAPVAPVVVSNIDLCYMHAVVIPVQQHNSSYTYRWYKNASATPVYTGNTYTEYNVAADFTMQVEALISGTSCASSRANVAVNSVAIPGAPGATATSQCGTVATFRVPSPDAQLKYNWYSAPKDGDLLLANNHTLIVPNAPYGVVTTYYAEAYRVEGTASCKSATRAPIRVTLNPIPVLTSNALSSYCHMQGSRTITVSGAATYSWAPSNLGTSATVYAPNTPGSYTYVVRGTTTAGCYADKAISFTVTPSPVYPGITFDDHCVPGPVTYKAASNFAAGTQYTWKSTDAAGRVTILKTSTNSTDNTLSHVPITGTTLEVTAQNAYGCTYKSNSITLNDNSPTALKFDGQDDKVTLEMTSARIKMLAVENKSFSIGFKISADAVQKNAITTIVSKRNKIGNTIYGYALFITHNGKRVTLQIDGQDYVSPEFLYSLNGLQCANVVVTVSMVPNFIGFDYIRVVKFYSGTTLIGRIDDRVRRAEQYKDTPLIIGNDNIHNYAFSGKMYDVSIWGKSLTTYDVETYWRHNFIGDYQTELARFRFRDNGQSVQVTAGTSEFQAVRGSSSAAELSDPNSICASYCTYYPDSDRMTDQPLEDELSEVKPAITASPNPFELQAEVVFSGFTSETVSLSLIDLNGVEVWRKDHHPVSEQLTIGDNLSSGMYILHAIGTNEAQTIKIIKMK